jgi:anaerobic selenocysteine-containing dehydrogenase/Fe-S-cluster-containing dehydrogenase component
MSAMDRRSFFKIIGVTGAAAAAGGCGESTQQLLPYVIPPENIVPGTAAYFSTVCRECPAGCGMVAKNRDGRVIKLEGNPDHPVSAGALCIRGQAGLQALYHPDRFRTAQVGGKPAAWDAALAQVGERLGALVKAGQGARIALVSGAETGSLGRLMDGWGRALGARRRIAYEPLGYEAMRAANRIAFGRDALPHYAIEDAAYVVSFGADVLETWLSPVEYARAFARMHALTHGKTGTVVQVEPRLSMTGANADEWVRSAAGTETGIALAMLRVILDEGLQAPGADARTLAAAAQGVELGAVASASGVPTDTIRRIARELAGSKRGLVLGGGVSASSPGATETQVAINLLNAAVGAVGPLVRFGPDSALGAASPYGEMLALTEAMGKGEIEVLLLVDVNPVYTLPATSGFTEALGKVPLVVALTNRPDETNGRAGVVLPALHPLESWGDFRARDGVIGLMQPAMGPVQIGGAPVAGTSTGDALLALGRRALGLEEPKDPFKWPSFEAFLKEQWQVLGREYAPGRPFVDFWEEALRRGGVWRTTPAAAVALRPEAARIAWQPPRLEGEGLALLVYPSARFYDGRSGDRPWLHEAPDVMTQVTWDGWVEVPVQTARQLGLAQGDLVTITSPHGAIELPAYLSASLHPGAVAVPMGQGHAYGGAFARRQGVNAGANPMGLLPAAAEAASGGLPHLSVNVRLARTGRRRPLAIPQATHDQDDRHLAQVVGLGAAKELELRGKPPEHASHPSMYPELQYPDHRWGMTVDLDLCTGCQACVIACVAENNIAVVGKEQVAYGRGHYWLRLERWEEGAPSHPGNIFLPMFCQHCGVAPCEPVCPVYASYHTQEGLNAQIYNRCVGTRYCGNNCPYHVRRFNWFNYSFETPLDLQLNPDVTVRQLGVMEKCTMCVQRIIRGKDHARDEGRKPRDGEIQTACQQTCPTRAITFGDLKDGGAKVTALSASPRGYHVLDELGTRPAVTYLKKVVRQDEPRMSPRGHRV